MKKLLALITSILILLSFTSMEALAKKGKAKGKGKTKVIYKKFTQYDFSGETVQGKIRTPEVFYIFQRRRSEGHRVVHAPRNFNHHQTKTRNVLKSKLPL